MAIKKFHLKDFPADRIRVLFSDNNEFIDESINYFGSLKKLADFLSVSPQVIHFWKKLNLFVPLAHIKKIVNERDLNWNEVESNVIAYKGLNSSLVVKNPKLPIIESPELFAIIAHLIGDGSVNRNNIPFYINSNKSLIDNFQNLISSVFGDIDGKIYNRTSNCYEFRSSRVIADLIKSFYNIQFYSLTAKFPTRIFELSAKYSCAVVRAIVDDEGHIRDNRVSIKMNNKNLIMQISKMLVKILGKEAITKLACYNDKSWEICIKSGYLREFGSKINLIHPRKSGYIRYAMKKAEYRKMMHRDNIWKTKLKILILLSDKPQTISDISRELFIDKGNITAHIRHLSNKSLIESMKDDGYFKCYITREGETFLKENLPKPEKININLMKIDYNNLNKKYSRILLNKKIREKLFWFLGMIFGDQNKISKLFNVHNNTINNWKNGHTSIPSIILNKMLIFLGEKGINLVNEVNTNIDDIKTINGRYKIDGGMKDDVCLCKPIIA